MIFVHSEVDGLNERFSVLFIVANTQVLPVFR